MSSTHVQPYVSRETLLNIVAPALANLHESRKRKFSWEGPEPSEKKVIHTSTKKRRPDDASYTYEKDVYFMFSYNKRWITNFLYEEVDIDYILKQKPGTAFLTTQYEKTKSGNTFRRGFSCQLVEPTTFRGKPAVWYKPTKPNNFNVHCTWIPKRYMAIYSNRFYVKRKCFISQTTNVLEDTPIGVETGIISIIQKYM